MKEQFNSSFDSVDSSAVKYLNEESKGKFTFIGEVHDTIHHKDGRVEKRETSFNVVVADFSRLIAALVKFETGLNAGKLFWALGSGQSSWDSTPYTAVDTTTKLVNEVYRKEITPAQRSFLDGNGNKVNTITNRLQLDIVIGSLEANGFTLREFGIFGGNPTGTKDSGIMINHKSHGRIDKEEGMIIERSVRFTF